MTYYHLGLLLPRAREAMRAHGLGNGYSFGVDFYQVWVTARECSAGCDIYGPEMTSENHRGLYGRLLNLPGDPADRRLFPYPAYTVVLFRPAAEFPFPAARAVFIASLAVLTFASALFWIHALSWQLEGRWLAVIILLTLSSYSVLEGLHAGQLGLLVGFLLSAAMLALRRGRFLLAGILVALTTIKPQMILLLIFYLLLWIWRDRGARLRFCVGLLVPLLLLLGASLALWSHWIPAWFHTLAAYRGYTPPALVSGVLGSLLGPRANAPASFLMIAALIIAALTLSWKNRTAAVESPEFWITVSLLLAITSVALLPGQAVYDHVILLPGIFLLSRQRRQFCRNRLRSVLWATGAAVLLWPWFAAFVLIALRLLIPHGFTSQEWLMLPLRTAAALPFVVLALLALESRGTRAPSLR